MNILRDYVEKAHQEFDKFYEEELADYFAQSKKKKDAIYQWRGCLSGLIWFAFFVLFVLGSYRGKGDKIPEEIAPFFYGTFVFMFFLFFISWMFPHPSAHGNCRHPGKIRIKKV